MTLPMELKLGPFRIDGAGHLSPASTESFPTFAVRWRGRRLAVRMTQCCITGSGRGVLEFHARLGRVPSTAGRDAAQRGDALSTIAALPHRADCAWRFRLLADHTVVVEADVEIGFPISVFSLVTELTLFLLALDPYLDDLDSVGMRPAQTVH